MTHTITFELPDAAYKRLVAKAKKNGKRVEDFVAEQIANGDAQPIDDPFEKFIGSLDTDIPDWADNHDKYIGDALYREMRGDTE